MTDERPGIWTVVPAQGSVDHELPLEQQAAIASWNSQARKNHRIVITGSRGGSKWYPFGYALKELEAKDLLNQVRGSQMAVMGVTMNELGESQDINKSNGYNLSFTFKKRAVKGFLRRGAAKRLHLEQLPGYAPDLNRDEGIWNYLKRVELANICCRDLGELHARVIRARERLRHKREIIRACSRQCGYAA